MKVWVIHSTGPLGTQLVAVVSTLSEAQGMMHDDTCTAVEVEVGKDYTDVRKYVVVTKENPKPRMIDFGSIPGMKPTVLAS
jgi:hypothetical protein